MSKSITLEADDVRMIAGHIKVKLTDAEIDEILEGYDEEEEKDPTATWNLIVEHQIHEIINNR